MGNDQWCLKDEETKVACIELCELMIWWKWKFLDDILSQTLLANYSIQLLISSLSPFPSLLSQLWFRETKRAKDVAVHFSSVRFRVRFTHSLTLSRLFNFQMNFIPIYSTCDSIPNFQFEFSLTLKIGFLREVMLEKQLSGHRVDRSICAWFWDQAISQPDSFKVFIFIPKNFIFSLPFTFIYLLLFSLYSNSQLLLLPHIIYSKFFVRGSLFWPALKSKCLHWWPLRYVCSQL